MTSFLSITIDFIDYRISSRGTPVRIQDPAFEGFKWVKLPKKNQSETEYHLSKVKLRVDVVSLTTVKRHSHNFPVLNDEYIFRRLTSPLLLT